MISESTTPPTKRYLSDAYSCNPLSTWVCPLPHTPHPPPLNTRPTEALSWPCRHGISVAARGTSPALPAPNGGASPTASFGSGLMMPTRNGVSAYALTFDTDVHSSSPAIFSQHTAVYTLLPPVASPGHTAGPDGNGKRIVV